MQTKRTCEYMHRNNGAWQFCGAPATARIIVATIAGAHFIHACAACKAESDHARKEASAAR